MWQYKILVNDSSGKMKNADTSGPVINRRYDINRDIPVDWQPRPKRLTSTWDWLAPENCSPRNRQWIVSSFRKKNVRRPKRLTCRSRGLLVMCLWSLGYFFKWAVAILDSPGLYTTYVISFSLFGVFFSVPSTCGPSGILRCLPSWCM